MKLSERLSAIDRVLVAKKFPPLSPWWVAVLTRFLDSGKRRLVVRAGRRAGKSSSTIRALVVLALWGEHVIPPGDVGVVPIVSVSRDEATSRLRLVRAILTALGVDFREAGDAIELEDARGQPIAFRVFAASLAGVVGFTAIAGLCDEVARWRDRDSGANPAKEVLASLRPTMATQPRARLFLVSSPMGLKDAHATAMARGTTGKQMTAEAATWVANPTISEADTREDEPDERVWLREYAAVPQSAALAAFDPAAVARAFTPRAPTRTGRRVLILDPSSGRKDAWTWAIAGWSVDARGEFFQVEAVDAVTGSFWRQASGDEIVDSIVALAKREGIGEVHADQRESLMLASAFQRRGLSYFVHDWTNANKVEAVSRIRRWLRETQLAICEHEAMRNELLAFEEKITPSGALTFAGARGEHDDHVALLITAAIADAAGDLQPARAIGTSIGSVVECSEDRYSEANGGAGSWF